MEKKRLFLRHPLLAALGLPILANVWISLPGVIPMTLGMQNDEKVKLTVYALCTVFALLLLLMHKHHYRPDYRGSFRKDGLFDKKAWICTGVFLSADLVFYIFRGIKGGFYAFNFTYIVPALYAGVVEETAFRVIPLSVIMFSSRNRRRLWSSLLMTSVFFGLFHFPNLKIASVPDYIILQVVMACINGFLLGALYLRTGNAILSMLLHALNDFICFLGSDGYAVLSIDITSALLSEEIILAVVSLVCTVILMKGQNEVCAHVWEERWSGGQCQEDGTVDTVEPIH